MRSNNLCEGEKQPVLVGISPLHSPILRALTEGVFPSRAYDARA